MVLSSLVVGSCGAGSVSLSDVETGVSHMDATLSYAQGDVDGAWLYVPLLIAPNHFSNGLVANGRRIVARLVSIPVDDG